MRRTALVLIAAFVSSAAHAQSYYPDDPAAHHYAAASHHAANAARHDRRLAHHFARMGDYYDADVASGRAARQSYDAHRDAAASHYYLGR